MAGIVTRCSISHTRGVVANGSSRRLSRSSIDFAQATSRFEQTACALVMSRLNTGTVAALEALFATDHRDQLASLREDPGVLGVDTVLAELAKLSTLNSFGVGVDVFTGFSARVLERWQARFLVGAPSHFAVMTQPTRMLITSAWVTSRRRKVTDGIVIDVLFPVVGEQTLRDLVREYKTFPEQL